MIERVRKLDLDVVIVVITGYATISTSVDAMKAGAYDFLPKPFTPDELRLIADRGFERWRLAKESERLRREKEEIERKFVTFVSHQLKSPLVAVKQYLDVLLFTSRASLPEKATDWIVRSQVRIGEMLTIIHDWLALAKLERGELCDKSASTDVRGALDQALSGVRPTAETSRVSIEVDLPSDLPHVRGDAVSLGTLFSNLLSNAVKYNRPGGKVVVRANRKDERTVAMEVSDTGIGIPAEHMPRLFGEFFRVKSPATQDIPGSGLGLAICKRIVSELGGTITAKSAEGEGTTFVLELPVAETKPVSDSGERT